MDEVYEHLYQSYASISRAKLHFRESVGFEGIMRKIKFHARLRLTVTMSNI